MTQLRHVALVRSGETNTKPLFLVEQTVTKPGETQAKTIEVTDNLNHIWIYDRSGSMAYSLRQLGQDMIERSRQLKKGDTLTLGWFSSERDFRWILKGVKVNDDADLKVIEKTILANISSLGMTCFSEILADTNNVLNDLKAYSNAFAMCFFTDGYPVVSSLTREIEAIKKAISGIRGRIASVLFVGYGNYYNKELMSQMAEWAGGALAHSETIKEFSTHLVTFIEEARETDGRVLVEIESLPSKDYAFAFSVNGKSVLAYELVDNKVEYTLSRLKQNTVYTIVDKIPAGSKEVKLTEANTMRGNSETNSMIKALYGVALLLTQRTRTDKALEVLGTLGDKHLIDLVTNSFTNTEYGVAEEEIRQAMSGPSKRFKSGRDTAYLPPSNAFCLVNVLDLLAEDEEAFFYPRHKSFDYERIGVKAENKSGYPEFEADPKTRAEFGNFVWNDDMLNLSARAKIEGTIEFTEGYAEVGFAKVYPTFMYRTYTLVKDGNLNMKSLPVSLSEASFIRLQSEGFFRDEKFVPAQIYTLDLTLVPIMNRAMAEGKTSATQLCRQMWERTRLQAELKVMRKLTEELEPETSKMKGLPFTEAQKAFLAKNGVSSNGFAPPSEKGAATDSYFAKEFTIKIKSFNAIPSQKDVVTKTAKIAENLAQGKKPGSYTPSEQMVKDIIENIESILAGKADPVKLTVLKVQIKDREQKLREIRDQIQVTKFQILLGKKWFDEFTSREDNTLQVDDKEFTVSLREISVPV